MVAQGSLPSAATSTMEAVPADHTRGRSPPNSITPAAREHGRGADDFLSRSPAHEWETGTFFLSLALIDARRFMGTPGPKVVR